MAERNDNVQLFAALADWDDVEDSEYRVLLDGKDVNYITTAPGIFPRMTGLSARRLERGPSVQERNYQRA